MSCAPSLAAFAAILGPHFEALAVPLNVYRERSGEGEEAIPYVELRRRVGPRGEEFVSAPRLAIIFDGLPSFVPSAEDGTRGTITGTTYGLLRCGGLVAVHHSGTWWQRDARTLVLREVCQLDLAAGATARLRPHEVAECLEALCFTRNVPGAQRLGALLRAEC